MFRAAFLKLYPNVDVQYGGITPLSRVAHNDSIALAVRSRSHQQVLIAVKQDVNERICPGIR